MKKVMAMLLAAVLAATMCGCSKNGEKPNANETAAESEAGKKEDNITIAFIVKSLENQFFTDTQEGAEARAEELGVNLTFLAPAGGQADIEGEVQLVEDSIIKGVDAIVLDASDNAALNSSIKKANDADIPVVLYNDTVDMDDLETLGGRIDSYVGLNSVEASKKVGRNIADVVGHRCGGHRRSSVSRQRSHRSVQRSGQPWHTCNSGRSRYGLQGHTVRTYTGAMCHCRRCYKGARHLREVRLTGLREPSHCGKRPPRATRRDGRI